MEATLQAEIVRRVRGAVPSAVRVILFGSQARGNARPDSDVDLLVVVPDGTQIRTASRAVRRGLWTLGIGFDVVVLTASEHVRLGASRASFARQLLAEGVVLDAAA